MSVFQPGKTEFTKKNILHAMARNKNKSGMQSILLMAILYFPFSFTTKYSRFCDDQFYFRLFADWIQFHIMEQPTIQYFFKHINFFRNPGSAVLNCGQVAGGQSRIMHGKLIHTLGSSNLCFCLCACVCISVCVAFAISFLTGCDYGVLIKGF